MNKFYRFTLYLYEPPSVSISRRPAVTYNLRAPKSDGHEKVKVDPIAKTRE